MTDPINLKIYPVSATPVSGAALTRLNQRLDLIEREIKHLSTAVADMRNGINRNDGKLLASGLMNSRNWALSVVWSQAYIQTMLGRNATSSATAFIQTMLWRRAAQRGVDEGTRDIKL